MNKSVKSVAFGVIERALLVCGALLSYIAYQLWGQYQWALRRLEGSFLLISGYPNFQLDKVFVAIREYATLFPLYFSVAVISVTSGLILIAMNSRKRLIFTASILLGSSVFPFLEAYSIWKVYQEAIQLPNPSTSFNALFPIINAYGLLFPWYLLFGSIETILGLAIIVFSLKNTTKQT